MLTCLSIIFLSQIKSPTSLWTGGHTIPMNITLQGNLCDLALGLDTKDSSGVSNFESIAKTIESIHQDATQNKSSPTQGAPTPDICMSDKTSSDNGSKTSLKEESSKLLHDVAKDDSLSIDGLSIKTEPKVEESSCSFSSESSSGKPSNLTNRILFSST